MLRPEESEIIVGIPTHDQRSLVLSILELTALSTLLHRRVQFVIGEGSNIPRSRNAVVEQIQRTQAGRATAWMLWLDSDILVPPGSAPIIAEAIRWAEVTHVAIVGNYRMSTGQSVLMDRRGPDGVPHHYTDAELAALPRPFPEVGLAGLGFTYCEQPLAYRFHADIVGEDTHFWWDHPELHIHWIPRLRLGHHKSQMLFT